MATPNPNPRALLGSGDDVTWQDRAACNGTTVDFVPDHETSVGLAHARLYCDGCPVRQDCLIWAMLYRCEGYWGGTNTDQRRQLLRVRTRAKCPLCLATQLVYADPHEMCLACGVSWVRDVREEPIAATPAPGAA